MKNSYFTPITLISNSGDKYTGEFISERVDPDSIPTGKFMYQCRHSDYNFNKLSTIEPKVVINFYGTFITDKEIEFPNEEDKYIPIKSYYNKI